MTLDPAIADLFAIIGEALDGMADWRVVAVCSAVGGVLAGDDDPGAAADWLREFLAQREMPLEQVLAEVDAAAGKATQ